MGHHPTLTHAFVNWLIHSPVPRCAVRFLGERLIAQIHPTQRRPSRSATAPTVPAADERIEHEPAERTARQDARLHELFRHGGEVGAAVGHRGDVQTLRLFAPPMLLLHLRHRVPAVVKARVAASVAALLVRDPPLDVARVLHASCGVVFPSARRRAARIASAWRPRRAHGSPPRRTSSVPTSPAGTGTHALSSAGRSRFPASGSVCSR
jgi:hypothetical protein